MTQKWFLAELVFRGFRIFKSHSAKNCFDVITCISMIFIKYLIQGYHLSIGYHN